MSRTTIDYGIDLGTTNSVIAVLNGTELEVVLNRVGAMLTPSAIYVDRRGQVRVGQEAKNKALESPDHCDSEFKTRMRLGDFGAACEASGKTMRPQDSSAEVLKSLRDDVRIKKDEEINAAVITIPADFSLPQCRATSEAAELAGLEHAPLLLEPVAAATAYGFQEESDDAYWLVYDFGGGTFDAAVMRIHDGQIQVVDHAGDNHLGGKNIDWAIVEQCFIPRLTAQYNLPEFHRGNNRWQKAIAKLKLVAEQAKIEVSRSSQPYSVFLDDPLCDDADGRPVDLELDLTPQDVTAAFEPHVLKSINLSKEALRSAHLAGSDLSKVILVGGTSLFPEVRERVQTELQSDLEFSIDPMTVVARGAAVFASTQVLPKTVVRKASAGELELTVEGPRLGPDDDPQVQGQLVHPGNQSLEGYTIEFVDTRTQWTSGRIPLRNGAFRTRLHADKGRKCEYSVTVRDPKGGHVPTNCNDFSYVIAMDTPKPPATRSIGIHTAENEVDLVLRKGDPLPARTRTDHVTARPFRRGQSERALEIPLVSGEQLRGDRNSRIGHIVVPPEKLTRDLPAGSDVFITVEFDTSMRCQMTAEIPFLDEVFTIEYNDIYNPLKDLGPKLEEEVARKAELERKARMHSDVEAMKHLTALSEENLESEIRSLIRGSENDKSCVEEAEEKLLRFQTALDRAEEQLEWPMLVSEARESLAECRRFAAKLDERDPNVQKYCRQIDSAEAELSRAIESRDGLVLKRRIKDLEELKRQGMLLDPHFWVDVFMDLQKLTPAMKDQQTAAHLIDMGQRALEQNDLGQLQSVVQQLIGLLPPGVAPPVGVAPAQGGGTVRKGLR